ncbi:phosphoserine transaminase [Sphingomicrobium maritimum]|uniref:phosphoserine transaminase n=1 Tax=Sphingomicrobium maritimum TaxID=3133972 RepID=UPI003D768BEE
MTKPTERPVRPYFSSGPCAKPPGWSPDKLNLDGLGRSHRGAHNKARLAHCIALMRELLDLPDSHRIGIVPGSDTGAFEMAMWTMLGPRPVTAMGWESFGKDWVKDVADQLDVEGNLVTADYGELPDLGAVDFDHDVLFTWNGTTSGVRVPDGDWIPADRAGLTFADSTSAVFAMRIPWDKVDVATFSWQKVLGGEAAHGVLILGPRAVERLETHVPDRPLPKLFRLTKSDGKLDEGIFTGATINTPSMLCVEDAIHSLDWARSVGGLDGMIARSEANAAAVDRLVDARDWLDHLCPDPALRSVTGVCLTADADPDRIKAMVRMIEDEGVAYDFGAYRDAPPGFRIWCGATVDTADIEALGPWLDWAWSETQ